MAVPIEQRGEDVFIAIKAVPNASRDQIAGVLGDRVKVRISAPPEAGKANKAICKLFAAALGVKPRQVTIETGHGSAEKTVRVAGLSAAAAARALDA